jgi:hypothetical protein
MSAENAPAGPAAEAPQSPAVVKKAASTVAKPKIVPKPAAKAPAAAPTTPAPAAAPAAPAAEPDENPFSIFGWGN